ncbi:hypothetical protein RGQ15_14895 [Paracoccus sp. MBLB3053]|uniref:Uncharacterized protein n=1 Tax=Paracoccus aurantius TaxID=3073814 RepID=A0ABU2HUX4_9RHOB|nr:hypothetical protein [Paracoccus sp. MBLB3053]MDS9468851.1 hypothetical protein [Paracoccus sp. MBLB3053]
MSHNTDPERAARRHPASIVGIILALVVAAIALVWWIGADDPAEEDAISSAVTTDAPDAASVADPAATASPDASAPEN